MVNRIDSCTVCIYYHIVGITNVYWKTVNIMKNTNRKFKLANFFTFLLHVLGSWFDWNRLKISTIYLMKGIKHFFVIQQQAGESFEAATQRLKLTEADLVTRKKGLLRLSLIMLAFACIMFFYAIYLLVMGSPMGGILALVVMLIALVLAFRYHFWCFQIQQRKLGCSINDWFNYSFRDNK